jgi:hypothetical protein
MKEDSDFSSAAEARLAGLRSVVVLHRPEGFLFKEESWQRQDRPSRSTGGS